MKIKKSTQKAIPKASLAVIADALSKGASWEDACKSAGFTHSFFSYLIRKEKERAKAHNQLLELKERVNNLLKIQLESKTTILA
jgi:hypothetical protein